MPSAVDAGVVDFILSPDKMTEKLLEVTQIINIPTSIDQNLPLGDEEVSAEINAAVSVKELISLITNKPLFAKKNSRRIGH
jgi:hypothetical protein